MKGKIRNTEVQINEEEIATLPEKEFRVIIEEIIKNLGKKKRKCKTQLTKT